MTTLLSLATVSGNEKIAIGVGLIVFVVLFFKLIGAFIRFFFRHPIWFLLLLLVGGVGFAFSFLLGGAVILAVLVGGGAFWLLGNFDQ
ncbi:hypothetical protein [Levilactobacillus namurensis]|uniref:hypothetical protein n=1 Tax=Levilactobacillus namurensis TaxID=380393 RepID=UPI0026EA1080|nr:hypothetical protein [Levilactobacillus namurensis]